MSWMCLKEITHEIPLAIHACCLHRGAGRFKLQVEKVYGVHIGHTQGVNLFMLAN